MLLSFQMVVGAVQCALKSTSDLEHMIDGVEADLPLKIANPFFLYDTDDNKIFFPSHYAFRSFLSRPLRTLLLLSNPENGVLLLSRLKKERDEEDYGMTCINSKYIFPLKMGLQVSMLKLYDDDGKKDYFRNKVDLFNAAFLLNLPCLILDTLRDGVFGSSAKEYDAYFSKG